MLKFTSAVMGSLILGSVTFAKSSKTQAQTALTPREIFRKTSGQWSGDIFLLPKRGNYMLNGWEFDPKTWQSSTVKGRAIPSHPINMHGVAWDYDLRIPIVFFDPNHHWFKAGQYEELAVQQDIAPTLASILDIPPPAKNGGRVLREALASNRGALKPKAIVIFVQDQMGRQYLAAHPGRAKFYESMISSGANYVNGSVAHVDVETSVGHAGIATGAWPSEHGVAGNSFWHNGIFRQVAALSIQLGASDSSKKANPNFFFTPSLSDVWSVARQNKPVILSVAPAARASISMGGHGALFNGGARTYVTWQDEFRKDGSWTTEEENYQLPQAFRGPTIASWIKEIADTDGRWRGRKLVDDRGKINYPLVQASPALILQQTDLTLVAISNLKIGTDDETDLVWINTKSTDYCGHLFGYESDECGETLAVADEQSKRILDLIDRQTGGNYLAVLTADHGAAPLPEVSGAYRIDKTKLKADLDAQFDRKANNIDAIQVVTSSQVYVNTGELALNGYKLKDVVGYLKQYKAQMAMPYNAMADEWIKRGKPRETLFFEDVVEKM
jgi:predicted AlkP superfamily pyrophosphatase or phosphodiesterase